MPSVIRVPDLRDGYVRVVNFVRDHGERVAPRGQPTRELLDVIVELRNPRDALPIGVGRKLNRQIGYAEAAQLIGAVSNPRLLVRVAPHFKNFLEDGGQQWGAYGDRINAQVFDVIEKLERDPDSRQALVTLWDPKLDNQEGKRDYPCTVVLQFLIRDGRLVLHTTMRSNDVWLGLAYDAFQFTQLQLTVARALDLPAGPYHHHAVSLHLYERDLEAADQLHPADRDVIVDFHDGIGVDGMSWHQLYRRAACLATGNTLSRQVLMREGNLSFTDRRYAEQLWGWYL